MTDFNFTVCCVCGIEFGVPKTYDDKRRLDGESFYCPGGHSLSYGEGETEKLRRERNQLKQRIAEKDDIIIEEQAARHNAERSASAYKGRVTRIKNRIGKGVCPCCNRSFENLQRHMASKHPDYADVAEKAA